MWPLGHVGHVTYSFINMLFKSTGIFVYHFINNTIPCVIWWLAPPTNFVGRYNRTAYPSGAPEFTLVFYCVTRSLVLCVMFCRPLCVILSFYFWHLCCLSFELLTFITPLGIIWSGRRDTGLTSIVIFTTLVLPVL
jgi:hypothetical protein